MIFIKNTKFRGVAFFLSVTVSDFKITCHRIYSLCITDYAENTPNSMKFASYLTIEAQVDAFLEIAEKNKL